MAFSDQQIISNTGIQLDSFIYHLWMRSVHETPAEQELSAALAPLLHKASETCIDQNRPFPSFAAEIMPQLRAVIRELNTPRKQPLSQLFRAARDNDAHILGMMIWRINDRAREWRSTGLQIVAQGRQSACAEPEKQRQLCGDALGIGFDVYDTEAPTQSETPQKHSARAALSLIVNNTRKPQP